MKRLLSMLLVIAMVISMIPNAFAETVEETQTEATVSAEETITVVEETIAPEQPADSVEQDVYADTSGNFTYTVTNGEATITDFPTSYYGWLNIPSSLGGYPVTAIGDNAFYCCANITSVTIPSTVITIGEYAFYGCSKIAVVDIPDRVTTIGASAFRNSGLTHITLPESLTTIGNYAFYGVLRKLVVNYDGKLEQWKKISIGSNNSSLTNGTFYFAKHDHVYESAVTAPTCTVAGYTTYTCTVCGDNYTADEVPALGHYVIEGRELVDSYTTQNDTSYPFSLSSGWYASSNKSHSSTSQYTISALYDCTLVLKYKVSSEANYDKLTIVQNSTTKDTISGNIAAKTMTLSLKAGDAVYIKYSKDSSQSGNSDTGYFQIVSCTQTEIGVGERVPVENVEPTCDEAVVCDGCKQTIKEKLTHKYATIYQPYTHTSSKFAGSDGYYYSTNGSKSSTGTHTMQVNMDITIRFSYGVSSEGGCDIFKIAHNGSTIVSISGEKTGDKVLDLSEGDTLVFTYSKDGSVSEGDDEGWFRITSGDNYINEAVTTANCAGDVRCIYCGLLKYSQKAHTVVAVPKVAPTCTAVGKTAGRACSKCSYIEVHQDDIPMISHTFVNGVCSKCGTDTYSEGITFSLSDDGTYYIVTGIGTFTGTDLVIPENYNHLPVKEIGRSAFMLCTTLTSVTISPNIQSMKYDAFSDCTGLKAVYISDMDAWCDISFEYESEWDEGLWVDSTANPLRWANNLYLNGALVTELTLDEAPGAFAFYGCSKLTSVKFTRQVPLNCGVFRSCSALSELHIPGGPSAIYAYALNYCSALRGAFYLPASVTSVGDWAFWGTNIDIMYLGGSRIPDRCDDLDYGNNSYFDKVVYNCQLIQTDGIDYVIKGGEACLIRCSPIKTGSVQIPSTVQYGGQTYQVTSIGEYAFRGCTKLYSLTIPQSVKTIGTSAFTDCIRLVEIRNYSELEIVKGSLENGSVGAYAQIIHNGASKIASIGDYRFITDDANKIYLFDYVGTSTAPTLPQSYNGRAYAIANYAFANKDIVSVNMPNSVTSIGVGAFRNCLKLESITISNGVTVIGASAFSNCTSLTSLAIPDSITTIGENAFYNCIKLSYNIYGNSKYLGNNSNPYVVLISATATDITSVQIHPNTKVISASAFEDCSSLTGVFIPDGVRVIGDRAFFWCTKLTGVTIPDSVTTIGGYAFYYCTALTDVNIPNSVTTIGDSAFSNCSKLTAVTIPDSVTRIGDSAFYYCTGLTSVAIGTSVTSIGDYAFYYCTGLTSVTIPKSVTMIGADAFMDCTSLTGIWVSEGNPNYSSDAAGVLFNKDKTTLYTAPGTISGSYTIPNSVTTISSCAFYNCIKLTGVIIPDSVTSIGTSAFKNCAKLTSITIPDSVTTIGTSAFSDCRALTGVIIPDSVTSIGAYAFSDCWALTSVLIGRGVTNIAVFAFYNCRNLTTIFIPGSIKTIGTSAFSYYGGLSKVYYGGTADQWKAISIGSSNTNLTDATVCYSSYAFEDYIYSLDNGNATILSYFGSGGDITIPATLEGNPVTSIGSSAFYNCSNLKSITLPVGITTIGSYAFYYCSGLTDVYITDPSAWCKIRFGDSYSNPMYYGGRVHILDAEGREVTQVVLDSTVTTIPSYAFRGCTSLIEITIPESVTSIGSSAFSGCSNLTDITLPDSITTIDSFAFSGCSSLNYNIYDNAKYLGNSTNPYLVLKEAASKDIISCNVHNGAKIISDQAFLSCSSLTEIIVSDSVVSIGASAFSGCGSLKSITLPFVGDRRKTASDTYQYPLGYIFGTSSYTGGVSTKQYYRGYSTSSTTYSTYYIPSSLEAVTITDGYVPYGAFYNCNNLQSITISDSVTSISSFALFGCGNLKSLTIPFVGDSRKTATSTYQYPFGYIFGTSSYTGGVSTTQYYYGSSTSSKTNTTYYIPSTLESVAITDGELLYGAFYNCSNLKSITLPDDITTIGSSAFYYCNGLTDVYITDPSAWCKIRFGDSYANPMSYGDRVHILDAEGREVAQVVLDSTVTTIPSYAFRGCTSLIEITIPESVTSIGSSAFSGCTGLTGITLPEGVITIGGSAFSGCTGLTDIALPESVTSIGSSAFYNCSNLTDVYYSGSKAQWNKISIGSNNTPLVNATIHFAKHSHEYEVVVTAPTCTVAGYTTHTCLCGDSYVTDEVAPLGHYVQEGGKEIVDVYTIQNDTTHPFTISSGWYASTNKNHSTTSTFTIRAEYDCTLVLKYKVSSESNFDKLTIVQNSTTMDTISGVISEKTITLSLKAGDVVYIKYSKDGSVSSNSDTGYFKIETEQQMEIDAIVRVPVADIEPTCTEGVVCDSCNQVIKAALGHDYQEEYFDGYKKCTCSRCSVEIICVAENGEEKFASLQEALDAYEAGVIQLLADVASVTVTKDAVVDLNGFSIASVIANDAKLTVMDSKTDDYTVADGSYGKIAAISGAVVAADGYIAITEEVGTSYHKVTLDIADMTLRGVDAGIYYNCIFNGDEKVKEQVTTSGVVLSVKGTPEIGKTGSACSVFHGFKTGSDTPSTLLTNVMKETCTAAQNNSRANMQVYGRAYIQIGDTYIYGETVSRSFREQVELVDEAWNTLTAEQKAEVQEMYRTYQEDMSAWTIPNIKASI